MMLRHIDWPMTPVPMKPTRVVPGFAVAICIVLLRRARRGSVGESPRAIVRPRPGRGKRAAAPPAFRLHTGPLRDKLGARSVQPRPSLLDSHNTDAATRPSPRV